MTNGNEWPDPPSVGIGDDDKSDTLRSSAQRSIAQKLHGEAPTPLDKNPRVIIQELERDTTHVSGDVVYKFRAKKFYGTRIGGTVMGHISMDKDSYSKLSKESRWAVSLEQSSPVLDAFRKVIDYVR